MSVFEMLPVDITKRLVSCKIAEQDLREIRIRYNRGLCVTTSDGGKMIGLNGGYTGKESQAFCVTEQLLRDTLNRLTGYSLYAFEEEIRQGFFTVSGGHRVGVAGHAVFEQGKMLRLTEIGYLNIRIAHEIKNCSKKLYDVLFGQGKLWHTLLFAPPGCGKTTYLRDLIRLLSEQGVKVGVADERSELAAGVRGRAQFDLGVHTDVMDGCPKAMAMQMLLRSMNPDVLAADELGTKEDVQAVRLAAGSGCKVVASAHAESMDELRENPMLGTLWEERRFERYVKLGKRGEQFGVEAVFDGQGEELWKQLY